MAILGDAPSLKEFPYGGPIERAEGGLFGPWCARIRRGQWFVIPRAEIGALDVHGPHAQMSVVAWIRREATTSWQAIAGVWDETRAKRQYCLFLNAPTGTRVSDGLRHPLSDRVHGHVSGTGGPTPVHPFCNTFSSGASGVPMCVWTCVAMTYDGACSRAYVNGRLDELADFNPFPYPDGLFDGGEEGADFTVGAVHRGGEWGNFFGGDIGGLAVFDRALTDVELAGLADVRSMPNREP